MGWYVELVGVEVMVLGGNVDGRYYGGDVVRG